MAKTYDPETLRRLQAVEMMIVRDFTTTCEKYGLHYWGFGGTGIGAIRHRGFIPWDDDIDLYLPRRDLEELIRHMTEDFGDKYYALNSATDPHYPLATTRMCLTGTRFREELMKDVDCRWGIFLDLYAVDYAAPRKAAFKRQMFWTWVYSKLVILYETPAPYLAFGGFKAAIVRAICRFVHWWLNFFPYRKKRLEKRRDGISERYNNEKSEVLGYFCDTKADANLFAVKDLYPLRELPFEKTSLYFPNKLEEGLTTMFGDYMTLPPEEKRKTHFPIELDFGPYAQIDPDEYLNPTAE